MKEATIPDKLKDDKFRFILLKEKDKLPIEKSWQTKKNYCHNDPLILQHISNNGNIGIVCLQGTPTIIDFDEEQCEQNVAPKLPRTFTTRSGRGRLHKYYLCPDAENLKILDDKKNTLADIQANKKQIVIPPSTHPNGNQYTVIDDIPLATIYMAEIKAAFLQYLPREKTKNATIRTNNRALQIKHQITFDKILRDLGIDTTHNPTSCPLGHESQGGKCFHFDDTKQVAHCFHCDFGGDIVHLIEQKNGCDFKQAIEWLAKKYNIDLPQISFSNTNRAAHAELADQIMTKVSFVTPMETDTPYFYKNGVYVPLAEAWIKSTIEEITEGEANKSLIMEVIEAIKRRTYCSLEEIDNDPEMLSVKNGILNVLTRELKPHTPNFKTFVQLPVEYDTNLGCALFQQFIQQIMSVEDARLVQEMFGYCLYRQYLWHKAIMLTGAGSNGKSTLLSVLKKLLGTKNTMSTTIQDLEYNRFSKAELQHKLANICPDLPPKVLSGTGTFKSLTGNDNITAERKGRDPFCFTNYAKLLFSANQIPSAEDDSDAFYRRWIIIRFSKQFSKETADPHLIGKISTAPELSGILNWALDGLQRMFEQSGFSENQTLEEVRDKYIHLSNPVRAFVTDCVNFDNYEDFVTKEILFAVYCNYCKSQHLPLISDIGVFVKKILSEFPTSVTAERRIVDGIRKQGFKGLSLNPPQILPLSQNTPEFASALQYTKVHQVTHKVTPVNPTTPRHISGVGKEVEKEEEVIQSSSDKRVDKADRADTNQVLQQISKIPTSFEHLENIFCKSLDWPVEQLNKTLLLLKQNGDVLENKPGYYVKLE